MKISFAKIIKKLKIAIFGLSVIISFASIQTVFATISDGENASDLIGQYSNTGGTTISYTKSGSNNSPNLLGFSGSGNFSTDIDHVHHRLFVSDSTNNRVLIFNLNSSDQLIDKVADNVLGQTTFDTNTGAVTQAGMSSPSALVYDPNGNRLFVANANARRVTVYDVASITDGENAVNVLGQATFTSSTSSITQAGMGNVFGLAYDTTNNRLFVSQASSNRVTVYDVASITNGENAINVLGQTTFTGSSASLTQGGFASGGPQGLAYDTTNSRLFIANGHRVTVYDVASITDGENAVSVLGQTNFTTNTGATTQAGMNNITGLGYDSTNSRLFVAQATSANRVTVYDVASITDGENAINVLGQTTFTGSSAAVTQGGVSSPTGVTYDGTNGKLFVSQTGANRVSIYDVASITDGEDAVDLIGQYSDIAGSTVNYTKSGANNSPNLLGLSGTSIGNNIIDSTNHRLFVNDSTNNRILIYNLNSSNQLVDKIPDNVLGQQNFDTNTGAVTQSGVSSVFGLAYDTTNNRLFVAQTSANRVTVYDVASITDGENAINVLGQTTFTGSSAAVTQGGMTNPQAVAYDATNSRLFVSNSNRVTVYDVASITDGENAINVLGQTTFTGSTGAVTQGGLSLPQDVIYDATNSRLFVSNSNRVTVYDVASITDGENAINVLGQTTFTGSTGAVTQGGMTNPKGLAYDATNSRLFVAQATSANRVTVYDVASITDGENAINVLGQTTFTGSTGAVTQAGMNGPGPLAYDATNTKLFVTNNNRITIYDVSLPDTTAPTATINQAGGQSDPTGTNPINFTVVFSEAIDPTTFIAGDITISGTGTATAGTPTTSDNITWTVPVTATVGGTIIASLGANKVTDPSANNNTAATSTDNTVTYAPDITAPIVSEVTPVTTPTNDNTPNYTFSTDEAGTISYGGSCSSATTSATVGNNTITFNTLSDGTYSNCTVTVTDTALNASSALSVATFVVDTTVPTLLEITPVTSPTSDHTPEYTFSSNEAGTITYGGSCSSATTSATVGNNTITFNTLSDGTYTDCIVTVTDTAGNISSVLNISDFEIITISSSNNNNVSTPASLINYNKALLNYNLTLSTPPQSLSGTTICIPLFSSSKNIILGAVNDSDEVKKLETFLNQNEGEKLVINGIYEKVDYDAVKRFQQKYFKDIISPFRGKAPTGIVANYTKGKINLLTCAKNLGCPYFTTNEKLGSSGPEVTRIQNFLNILLNADIPESGTFDQKTYLSVKKYQELYKESVLKPLHLKSATGLWYEKSREASNHMMGCGV